MPKKPPRPCRQCGTLLYDGADCPNHPRQVIRRLPRVDNRPSATERGYGWNWKIKVRDPFIAAHPWCVDPYKFHSGKQVRAVLIDHIIPRRDGGTDEWNNLQGLCIKCHQNKTASDKSRRRGDQKYGDPT